MSGWMCSVHVCLSEGLLDPVGLSGAGGLALLDGEALLPL